jgi:hypothetical protein
VHSSHIKPLKTAKNRNLVIESPVPLPASDNTESDDTESDVARDNPTNDPNVDFEVDKVINHRITEGKLQFLIQWKGYRGHDSWVSEASMSCPAAVEEYFQFGNAKWQ